MCCFLFFSTILDFLYSATATLKYELFFFQRQSLLFFIKVIFFLSNYEF
jgi:hypothetical protein